MSFTKQGPKAIAALHDAGLPDVAEALGDLFKCNVSQTTSAESTTFTAPELPDLSIQGGAGEAPSITTFEPAGDSIPDPGNFPDTHDNTIDPVTNMNDGFSTVTPYFQAPQQRHNSANDGLPVSAPRYDASSIQVSGYASSRSFNNDVKLESGGAIKIAGNPLGAKDTTMWAIATGSGVTAASGTTLGSGTAVLCESKNGVITPSVFERGGAARPKLSLGQSYVIGADEETVSVADSQMSFGCGIPAGTMPTGPSNGGGADSKRSGVWTITPSGSGRYRTHEVSGLQTGSALGDIYPWYKLEGSGEDLSPAGLHLTENSPTWSSTSAIGSTSANFQNSSYYSIDHNDRFTPAAGGGMRVSFWYRAVSSPSVVVGEYQGIITKGSIKYTPGSPGTTVFNGEWGIFHKEQAASGDDLFFIYKSSSVTLGILADGNPVSTGSWYFFDLIMNEAAGTCALAVRGAATLNKSVSLVGTLTASTDVPLTIGSNTEGEKLGASSGQLLIDGVSFSKNLSSPTSDEMYNSGSGYDPGYTGGGGLPSSEVCLITGTYQTPDNRGVFSSVTGTRPAIRLEKPRFGDTELRIKVGESVGTALADFTENASVADIKQLPSDDPNYPGSVEITWKGDYAGFPVTIGDIDQGGVMSDKLARQSDCVIEVKCVGSGAPDTARLGTLTGPGDTDSKGVISDGRVDLHVPESASPPSGVALRNPSHGEAKDAASEAKTAGYSPGGAITVRNPTGSSKSSGDVFSVGRLGDGWVVI